MNKIYPYFYTLNPDIIAYENAWLNYQKTGECNSAVIKDIVSDSWERCRKRIPDPLSHQTIPKLSQLETLNKLSKNQVLLSIISPYINTIFAAVEGPGFMVTFSDNDAIILQAVYDDVLQKRVEEINLTVGANMDEDFVGTNSIDLVIKQKRAVSIIGAEHYREIFHNLASISAPIFDYTNNIIGVLTVWGRNEHSTTHVLGMLTASAKAIENEIKIRKINEQLTENNNQLTSILQSVQNGVIYVKDNMVVQSNDVMLQLLGRKKINNEHVENVIVTSPEINELIDDRKKEFDSMKATLFCGSKNYSCLINKRTVIGSHGEELGQVLIFVLVDEIQKLSKVLSKHTAKYTFEHIIGQSDAINESKMLAQKASEHDSRIIIEGESGTGKEMFAQSIHNMSSRKNRPFVAIDCGAIPAELFESTLFGYEKGAFTGAKTTGSIGAFETAQNGTLFLDEIGNMPIDMQIKLLRVLQEKTITRVGSTTPIHVNVRVIAATNEDLRALVEAGKFREDLFYRLNVIHIKIPPLRDRKTDIPLLVKNYLLNSTVRNREIKIDEQAITLLQKYDWPGNIRQLFNTIERAEIMVTGNTIHVEDLPPEIIEKVRVTREVPVFSSNEENILSKKMTLREFERLYILHQLSQNNNNITKTAKELGVARPTIYKIINTESEE